MRCHSAFETPARPCPCPLLFHDIQPDKAGNLEIGAVPQGLGHKTETVFYRAGPVAERNFIKILMNRGEIVHLLIVVEISQNTVVKPRLALGVRVGSPVAGQHRFYFRQGGAGLQHLGDHLGRNRIFLQNFAGTFWGCWLPSHYRKRQKSLSLCSKRR